MVIELNKPSDTSVTCIFCGISVYVRQRVCTSNRWLNEFRASKFFPKQLSSVAKGVIVYNECEEWNSPKVSGIGDRCIDDAVPVHFDKHRKEYGTKPSDELRLVWESPREPDFPLKHREVSQVKLTWGYFGHASCWALFQAVCAPCEVDLRALNELCRSIPMRMHGLGLDYGRVPFTFLWSSGQERGEEPDIDERRTNEEIVNSPRKKMYAADPLMLEFGKEKRRKRSSRQLYSRNLRYSRKLCSGVPSFMNSTWFEKISSDSKDFFQKMPLEIISQILVHLPSRDVLSAKIASSTLASTELTKSFWESRFHIGHEFHCIFDRPFPVKLREDWKMLFEISRAQMSTWSFKNRLRIWTSLLQLKNIVSGMSDRQLYGEALRTFFEQHHQNPPRVPRIVSAEVTIRRIHNNQEKAESIPHIRETGCKVLYSRILVVPADVESISATVVHHGSRVFVAGLRFQSQHAEDVCIGYLGGENLETLDLHGKSLAGFRVSASMTGICGISAMFNDISCSTALGWMGTLPRRQMVIPKNETFTIKCDFDVSIPNGSCV
jgi:hypothetical protein